MIETYEDIDSAAAKMCALHVNQIWKLAHDCEVSLRVDDPQQALVYAYRIMAQADEIAKKCVTLSL